MKFVIQRVLESSVKVDGETIGQIGKGFMVLIGVGQDDTKEIADKMVKKMVGLRIFEDENGKTNRSLSDVNGSLLVVSRVFDTCFFINFIRILCSSHFGLIFFVKFYVFICTCL